MKRFLICVATSWLALACGPAEQGEPNRANAGGAAGGTSDGSSSAGTANDSGASTGGSGAGTANEGGASTGGNAGRGADSDGASPDTNTPRGLVQFGRFLGGVNAANQQFQASARFYAKDTNTGSDCTTESFGTCHISTCTPNDAALTPKPYAGTIRLSDGNTIDVTLMGTKGRDYTLPSGSAVSVSGGEVILVTASGDEVPPFTLTVAIPKVITIKSPTLNAMGVAKAPRSAELVLVFDNRSTDGETGTTLVVQSLSPTGSINMYCDLPTSTGTASIPREALSKLDAGTSLLLLTARYKQVQAGEFNVTVTGYISAMTSDKSAAATIQLE